MPEYKFKVYRDKQGEWRWTMLAPNGRKIADSAEGYKKKSNCLTGLYRVRAEAQSALIIELPSRKGRS